MGSVENNHFTCPLGQVVKWKEQAVCLVDSFETVIQLIDEQAKRIPQRPAIGLADFHPWRRNSSLPDSVTFQELQGFSMNAARDLSTILEPPFNKRQGATVGLLCTSSMDFVLTWLGLMRLGFSVLLLAPQLQPLAVKHLCTTLEVEVIFVDDSHVENTRDLRDLDGIKVLMVPAYQQHATNGSTQDPAQTHKVSDVACIFHTSGTLSGLPKPIIQNQHEAVGCLPCFLTEDTVATFSTTPLYHGGLADCLRAWTGGAFIWLFPEGLAPITGGNITNAIGFARDQSSVPIKYFSSVPYVLQTLAEEEAGIRTLQSMDLVGVGGAALPSVIGDKLVRAGVNLLSRLGSAECGFLMSSHRDYSKDKEWQYLRPIDDTNLLSFEPRENGLFELVVKPSWPVRIKINRQDGSYATSDLFEPHPSKPNAWRYHSRADAQITLANGKKFDPSPLEEGIGASTDLLQGVLIFGTGRDYAGALLFPKLNTTSDSSLIEAVWPLIHDINRRSQSHARIARSMLVVVPTHEGQMPLEKSSKGTILRRLAEERYSKEIDSAYTEVAFSLPCARILDNGLASAVSACFYHVLGRKVDPSQYLYRQGVDSIECIQIRKLLEATFLPQSDQSLPINVVYDQGTVDQLVSYMRTIRGNTKTLSTTGPLEQLESMRSLARKYSDFRQPATITRKKHGTVVVLTGSTGFLGSHILHLLCQDDHITKVYCLLRAQTSREAYKRVAESLLQRGLTGLEHYPVTSRGQQKAECLVCDICREDLGLSDEDRQRILDEATLFIHSAWAVNFNLRLPSFEDHIAGTHNLISLATESGARFVFISSTASVSCSSSKAVEIISQNPSDSSPLGYSQSKWVAESISAAANDSLTPLLGYTPISIIRVGQLCSNEAGVWNAAEAYPLMLLTAKVAGCLPDLSHDVLNWLPVEIAAKAVLDIAFHAHQHDDSNQSRQIEQGNSSTPVYHVLNPHESSTWSDMLQWISEEEEECSFEVVPPSDWIRRVGVVFNEEEIEHPSQALLGMWEEMFLKKSNGQAQIRPSFETVMSKRVSPTMRDVAPLERWRVVRMWKWLSEVSRN